MSSASGDGQRNGKAALFSGAPVRAPASAPVEGRRAVFSSSQRRRGDVLVECQRCDANTPVPLVEMGLRLLPSLWIPGRAFSRLMRCPACREVTWCRVHWRAAFD